MATVDAAMTPIECGANDCVVDVVTLVADVVAVVVEFEFEERVCPTIATTFGFFFKKKMNYIAKKKQ